MQRSLNLFFLVYDSRSGSTIFSKLITESLSGVVVTPEISFLKLFSFNRQKIRKSKILINRDEIYKEIENLGIDRLEYDKLNKNLPDEVVVESYIKDLLLLWMDRSLFYENTVVIKGGIHLKRHGYITNIIPSAEFVFLVRHPNSVIYSKLNTKRPYYPYESMAWGGILLAAIRWNRYVKSALNINICKIYFVWYEDFVLDHNSCIEKIKKILRCDDRYKPEINIEYIVPVKELGIHTKINNGVVTEKYINNWMGNLKKTDVEFIERFCSKYLYELGYGVYTSGCSLKYVQNILFQIFVSTYRVFLHYFRVIWNFINEN